jgi:hypothetical protein
MSLDSHGLVVGVPVWLTVLETRFGFSLSDRRRNSSESEEESRKN